jgi:hypothetical protein
MHSQLHTKVPDLTSDDTGSPPYGVCHHPLVNSARYSSRVPVVPALARAPPARAAASLSASLHIELPPCGRSRVAASPVLRRGLRAGPWPSLWGLLVNNHPFECDAQRRPRRHPEYTPKARAAIRISSSTCRHATHDAFSPHLHTTRPEGSGTHGPVAGPSPSAQPRPEPRASPTNDIYRRTGPTAHAP